MPFPLTISKSSIIDHGSSSKYYFKPFFCHSNQNNYAETLIEGIVNETAGLYKKMVKEFTNETMTNAAADSSTNTLPSMIYLDEQADHTQTLLAYRHITQTSVYD